MGKCIIVGGAEIKNYTRIREFIHEDDFVVCCDSGLKHLDNLGGKVDLIVGDFDSHPNPMLETETIVLPTVKDDTDTVYAVKEMIRRGFSDFVLVGVTGGRFDHTFGNVAILLMLDSAEKKGTIVDDYCEMEIVSTDPAYIEDCYKFFSLLNISGIARGITVENAKFILKNAEITSDYQYGISNETIIGKVSKVTVGEGRLLLVKNIVE